MSNDTLNIMSNDTLNIPNHRKKERRLKLNQFSPLKICNFKKWHHYQLERANYVTKHIFLKMIFVMDLGKLFILTCTANQLTGFYMRATLALNGLISARGILHDSH